MMSTVGAAMASDTTAALVLAHSWGDRRRRSIRPSTRPSQAWFCCGCVRRKLARHVTCCSAGNSVAVGLRADLATDAQSDTDDPTETLAERVAVFGSILD